MRVVCFANNVVGLEAVRHLNLANVEIVALVVHEPNKQKLANEIVATAGVSAENVLTGNQLRDPATLEQIVALQPDCGVSAFFGHILKRELIDIFPRGIVNLHTSLLPLNRGSFPNVWTIVDQTPAGVTLHLVDEGVDTGPILAQSNVEVCLDDTGLSLNSRLETAMIELFKTNWKKFAKGELVFVPQNNDSATLHRGSDTQAIDHIDLNATYRAGDLINILRARTYPPHRGAYFEVDGHKYFMQLDIEKE